jgi:hypothetical protein
MKFLFTVLFAIVLSPSVSSAKNAWTQCGIGALIFPSVGWAAATTNIWWDLGTTATSSSSTSPGQCAGKGSSVGKLIYENYANVEEETAKGEGEHLTAMLSILECDTAARSAIINDVRVDFMKSVSSPGYVQQSTLEKTEGFFNNVMDKASNKYAGHCSAG